LALLALEVDSPAIARLFAMYDQHARSMEAVSQALVVRGSTGQIGAKPLAELDARARVRIVRLENGWADPAARTRMGSPSAARAQPQAPRIKALAMSTCAVAS
jgi:hypothetical protein